MTGSRLVSNSQSRGILKSLPRTVNDRRSIFVCAQALTQMACEHNSIPIDLKTRFLEVVAWSLLSFFWLITFWSMPQSIPYVLIQ